MKLCKKILSVIMVLLIFFSATAFGSPFSLNANAQINWGYSVYISTYGQVVNSINFKGVTVNARYAPISSVANYDSSEFSCAGFVKSFYKSAFGIDVYNLYPGKTPLISSGSGYFYKTTKPVVGDIAANSGHWTIIKEISGNTITLIEQNAWYDDNKTYAAVNRKLILPETSYWFWHYSENFGPAVNWYDNVPKADLDSSFYACISKSNDIRNIGHLNGNVELTGNTNAANEIWYFIKQSDGSYVIFNTDNNQVLTVAGAGKTNGTNIILADYASADNQKWFIHGSNGVYSLRSKHSNMVLDVDNGYSSTGTNVHLWNYNATSAQLLAIRKCEALEKPVLSVSVSGNKATLSWDDVSGASAYILSIYKNSTASGSPYIYEDVTATSFATELPDGSYSAVLQAWNALCSEKSEIKTFSVKTEKPTDDGWTYAPSIPSGVSSKDYEIQFSNIYTKVSKTSPGSEWKKNSLSYKLYENNGDVYYSNLPLETSATRELVNYSYYHYCGNSTGNDVNYAPTSTFNHFDGISKENVYEFYSHADYADSRYTFYGLKYNGTDTPVYCHSDKTCDGVWGTHGNRSYYWYKQYAYQDKVLVEYYNYTKNGDWVNYIDTNASGYDVRYRKKAPSTAPQNLTAISSNSAVKLTWDPVKDAISYKVYQKTSDGWNVLGSISRTNATITKLAPNTKYTFAVMAGKKIDNETVWMDDYSTVSIKTLPETPKIAKIEQNSNAIRLTWSKCAGADGYRIYQKTSTGWKNISTTSNTSTTIKNLKSGTNYTFAIRPYAKINGAVCWSSYLTVTASTSPDAPTAKTDSFSKGTANISWNAVNGAQKYQLYYKIGNGNYKLYKTYSSAQNLNFKNLKSGSTYTFAVRAYKTVNKTNIYSAYKPVSVKIK